MKNYDAYTNRIIEKMEHEKSVIFENNFTGRLTLFDGEASSFDPINKDTFVKLRADGIIVREKCICQGDTRYILA